MTTLRETIEVERSQEEAFDYVADFSTTAEWDPGIAEASMVGEGPIGVGTRFEVVALFNGKRLPLVYEITSFERPGRVALHGSGSGFEGIDEIAFSPGRDGSTRIAYTAEIRLKGLARLAEPFMGGRFEEMARTAVDGLRTKLDAGASAPRR
jgi:carbon monoxide dehydrogenase subunit G